MNDLLPHIRFCSLLALLVSSTAAAQETDTTYVLQDTVRVEAERVYSAASNASFRAADFELRPRNSAQDILRLVPGLMIAQHAGGGKAEQIFLRGFDADHGTDVNLSVDGAPVNMISHGHGQGYADLHFIIPETIAEVDVVKGPYFARHGDLATAGAVSFSTLDVLKENLVKVEGGSFDTYRGVALVKTPELGASINGYFGAEVFTSKGYFEAPQDYRRVNLFAKLHSLVGERGSWSASVSTFSSGWDASGQVPVRAVERGELTRFGAIDPTEGGATSRTTAVVNYSSGGNEAFTLSGGFTDYRFRLFSNFTFFLNDSARGDGIEQTDDRSILSLRAGSIRLWELGGALMRTRFGASLRSDDIAVGLYHDSARVRLETTVNASIRSRQIGPYVEQEISLPWAQFLIGLRADYLNVDVENLYSPGTAPEGVAQQLVLSPKANVAIPVTDAATLFLNSGFGFHSNDARAIVGNSNARTLPRAFGAEVGARYGSARDVISVSAAAWMLALESELVYVGDEGTTEESGRTLRTGVDLEGIINPLDWLALSVDATISRGRFRDLPDGENFIPLAPDLTLTASAVVRHDDFSAALRLRHVGDRPANEDNSVQALGYSILDLSTAYRLGAIELFVNVENLLDAEWNEAQFDTESRLPGESESTSELHFTPGTPLSVRGGVAVRF
jgi:outer membrane receptor protein involved in Fe transport